MYTVQVDHISFDRNEERGEDGAVWFLILSPCPDDPCTHICGAHPQMVHTYERQGFRRGKFGHRKNATRQEVADNRANVWGWDGNTVAPTLTPSFLAAQGRPYRLHSYITQGQLVLCADSTVQAVKAPVQCTDYPPITEGQA
jgi:Family of unknown function (DUF6527)